MIFRAFRWKSGIDIEAANFSGLVRKTEKSRPDRRLIPGKYVNRNMSGQMKNSVRVGRSVSTSISIIWLVVKFDNNIVFDSRRGNILKCRLVWTHGRNHTRTDRLVHTVRKKLFLSKIAILHWV